MNLPCEFENRMKALLGAEYDDFASSLSKEAVRALRVNTNKISVPDFQKICDFPVSPIAYCAEGFTFSEEHIGSHPLHLSGAFYSQEPAAMAPVECARIAPGMKILDVCASPGGKSTQAAAKLGAEGVLVANEIDPARARTLLSNVERLGFGNIIVTNTDSAALKRAYRAYFDLVIVDAPCSGEGMMRKNSLAVSEWSIENIEKCALRQHEILENASQTVAPGGCLLYSTCTYAPEENEMQIDKFLTEHEDFLLLPVPEKIKNVTSDGIVPPGSSRSELTLCRRFYPHKTPGEGQFMALLCRKSIPEAVLPAEKQKKKEKNGEKVKKDPNEQIIRDFLCDVLTEEGLRYADGKKLIKAGEKFFLCPDICLPESGVKAAGVAVGEVRKGRVIPEHHFFMAYGSMFKRRIELSAKSEDTLRYLHGETIKTDTENGFAAVFVGGCTAGGAKVSGGEAKNYYPKGLRI